ncbi:protein CFAP20DC isoform X1 [Chaetodon auriga]|uniref:protein CFAP20DC isoform X1 n=1 Tax=Chaetodon auriga TaxID=39042 RepID=UPI0040331310
MFRSNFQGGAVVEIFSGQGKDPVAKWKLSGGPSSIHKEYNKEVKGFVYCLEGSSQTIKMQIPENGKMSLGLLQRFLVLQVNIPQCKDFSVELVITDVEHLKRRLHLSTVHKELSSTLLHAKIPFVGLKRNIWSALCIDLVSFTSELFKGFLTLDVITLFATCKVRRIFTMKTEPAGMSDDGAFLSGAGLMDSIPRSCQFPPDVSYVTQVLNMENLQKADVRAGPSSSDCASDESATARSTSYRRTRPQGVLHTASGSRVSGPPTQIGRKSKAASDGMDINTLFNSNMGSSSCRLNQKVTAENQSIANSSENLSQGEPSDIVLKGTPGSLRPHPPKDRVFENLGSKNLRVYGAGRERLAPSDAVPGGHRKRSKTREKCTPPSSRQESRQQPLTRAKRTQHLTGDECSCSPVRESSRASPTTAESVSCSVWPGLSCDLQACSSWESNEGSEPQLTLQDEVFTFLSQPHSPKRGQGRGDQEKMEMGNHQVQSKSGMRHEAQPEDDFIGSESDEDKSCTIFQHQRTSDECNPATPGSPCPGLDVQLEVRPESHNVDQTAPKELNPVTTSFQSSSSGRAEPAAPTRCLSPGAASRRQEHKCDPRGSRVVNPVVNGNSGVSLSRRLLQEVKLDDFTQHEVLLISEEDNTPKPVDSSDYNSHPLGSLQMHGDDDEELRMLASLKREQEEDEPRASGLSASQIHQCNISISMSSDDTSTWTHISMPANQGHHYQKEMNPLLQSNPREWMDVLSPPIMPPSQQRRSGNTWNNQENLIGGRDEPVNEEEKEDDYLNLLYDPCLNCYFDPKTGKYYELA